MSAQTPWGFVVKQPPACSLTDVMSEQLAKQLDEENEAFASLNKYVSYPFMFVVIQALLHVLLVNNLSALLFVPLSVPQSRSRPPAVRRSPRNDQRLDAGQDASDAVRPRV